MNIFFFGGTFDPPHKGHKLIYKHCMKICDKFIFVPTLQSPDKKAPITNKDIRINMLELLIDKEDKKKVLIDNFEINSKSIPNYTIDTINYLQNKFEKAIIHMVIGGDQYNNLKNWKDYKNIIEKVKIICFNRKIVEFKNNKKINFIDFNYDISSTLIRKNISSGKANNIQKYLTEDVNRLICDNDLYKN